MRNNGLELLKCPTVTPLVNEVWARSVQGTTIGPFSLSNHNKMPRGSGTQKGQAAGLGGSSPLELVIAIECEDETRVRNLLRQNKDALERSPNNDPAHTPLFKAVSLEHVGCVRLLIEAGADTSRVDREGTSVLHLACRAEDPAKGSEMVRQLVYARCELELRDRDGFTPLMRASLWGMADGVRYLLDAGADARITHMQHRRTPNASRIHMAAARGLKRLGLRLRRGHASPPPGCPALRG